jgi:hypothetical protein
MFKIPKKIHFEGNLCYLHSARQLGYKKRNFFGIAPRMEGSKTLFQPRWPNYRHILGLGKVPTEQSPLLSMRPPALSHFRHLWLYALHNVIFLLVFLLLVFRALPQGILAVNEPDVLIFARHFLDKSFIPNDWYLTLSIPYRYVFNIFAGALALAFPLPVVSITGRLVQYGLFAWVIQKFARHFALPAYLLLPFLSLYIQFPNIIAGEWLLPAFEAKVFAYLAVFLALYYFMVQDYLKTCIFLGLSISFHVLVGLYGTFCLFGAFLANYRTYRADLQKLLRSLPLFFLMASVGLYAALQNLWGSFSHHSQGGAEIYAKLRNAHHVYPSSWEGDLWTIKLGLFTLFLVIFFHLFREKGCRLISAFALSSLVLFGLGFMIYWIGADNLLKFYWFRFPDVVLPFWGFFAAAVAVNYALKALDRTHRVFSQSLRSIALLLSGVILLGAGLHFTRFIAEAALAGKFFYLQDMEPDRREILFWIKHRTAPQAMFLADPFCEKFYLVAERPLFVSFKHAPQSEPDILEWHRRLKMCNNNNELLEFSFHNKAIVQQNFHNLDPDSVKKLAQTYSLEYFLTKKNRPYPFRLIYANETYVLYSMR